jgi:hypothetical protein
MEQKTTGELVAELEAEHPDYQVWTVDRYIGGTLYCARRRDGTGTSLNADTPGQLREYIAEAEADR